MGGFQVAVGREMEVAPDFFDALGHGCLGNAMSLANFRHGYAFEFGIAERDIKAINGEAGAVLGADVADEAATKFKGIGKPVGKGDGGGLFLVVGVHGVVVEIDGRRGGIFERSQGWHGANRM
jgi:hypothetical protein